MNLDFLTDPQKVRIALEHTGLAMSASKPHLERVEEKRWVPTDEPIDKKIVTSLRKRVLKELQEQIDLEKNTPQNFFHLVKKAVSSAYSPPIHPDELDYLTARLIEVCSNQHVHKSVNAAIAAPSNQVVQPSDVERFIGTNRKPGDAYTVLGVLPPSGKRR